MERSDDVDWVMLGAAMTAMVLAVGLDEVADAIVRGCDLGVGSRSATVWLIEPDGTAQRLASSDGASPSNAESVPDGLDASGRVSFGRDEAGSPTCDAVVVLDTEVGVTVWLRGTFDGDDHFGPARRGALGLLRAVAVGALTRSRSSENARRIGLVLQRHLLPNLEPVRSGQAAVRYVPAGEGAEVGGDWYDIVDTRDGRTVLVLGDVLGHSVEAAVQMSELRTALHSHLLEGLPAGLALARVNDLWLDRGGFATCCCVEISGHGAVVTSAGHPPPILVSEHGQAITCDVRPGPPLGAVTNATYGGSREPLHAGDVIVLYSDGLVEERGGVITDGIERVRRAAANTDLDDLEQLATHLLGLAGPPSLLRDDIAILAFRPTSYPSERTDANDRSAHVPTGQLPLDTDLVWRLIDASPDALIVTADDGTIVLANQRTEDLFGHSRSELIGQSVDILLPAERRAHHEEQRDTYLHEPSIRSMGTGVFRARRQDGDHIDVDVSLSPVRLGPDTYVIATVRAATQPPQTDRQSVLDLRWSNGSVRRRERAM